MFTLSLKPGSTIPYLTLRSLFLTILSSVVTEIAMEVVYVRESTLVTKHPSLELLLVEAKFTNSPTLLGIYYRPPSVGSANLEDLECALESLQPSRLSNSILMGDFNIDLSKNSMQIPSHFHLTQVVSEPTRLTDKGSSLIDHVYISDHLLLQSCSTSPPSAHLRPGSRFQHQNLHYVHTAVLFAIYSVCCIKMIQNEAQCFLFPKN